MTAPPGRVYDVGGHRLHILVAGSGHPPVVLEAGGAGWSLDWYPVIERVSPMTTVCAYDRAGCGWSEPGPLPRTSERIAAELRTLLRVAGLPAPYLLVGASFGGHTVRLFAHHHPDEVCGVVLVDARHEDLDARMPASWRALQGMGRWAFRWAHLASRLGVPRLLSVLPADRIAPPFVRALPPELRSAYPTVAFRPAFFRANLDELAAVETSDRQVAGAGSLGEIPLTVVRHGVPSMFAGMPRRHAERAEQVWQELQDSLARVSSRSRLLVAATSGHRIQVDQPDLVAGAIEEMLEMVRQHDRGDPSVAAAVRSRPGRR